MPRRSGRQIEKLELARKDGAELAVANALGELASVLAEREALPSALKEYDEALNIYKNINTQQRIAFNNANRGNIFARLGHYDQAEEDF